MLSQQVEEGQPGGPDHTSWLINTAVPLPPPHCHGSGTPYCVLLHLTRTGVSYRDTVVLAWLADFKSGVNRAGLLPRHLH